VGSFHLYYYQKITNHREILEKLVYQILHPCWPRDKVRFFVLLFANCVNYALTITVATKGLQSVATQDFPNFILAITMLDLLIYLVYYIAMKYRYKERVDWRVWILFASMLAVAGTAIYFYNIAVTNKFLTPEESMLLNKPCVVFGYFDDHDVWHFLSAAGVTLLLLVVYFLDIDVAQTPCRNIVVF